MNTELPLMTQALDTATPLRQAGIDQQNNAMNHEKILSQHYDNMNAREKSRLSSVVSGAVQLEAFLKDNDFGGAYNFLTQRKNAIQRRMANGEDLDTEDTDAAIQMLNAGNIDELMNNIQGLKAAGQVYGIYDPSIGVGGDTGALINRLIKEGSAKNVQDALQQIKGGAGRAGQNAADISTGNAANYATQSGKNAADLQYAAPTASATAQGKAAGETIMGNNETLGSLDNLAFSIQQAKVLLPKVSMTGPIFGRVGAVAEDPDYQNLQGVINSITLQAKDLYNLGSGQGFTDADRDFLREVVAGKYARSEAIGSGLARFEEALKHRAEFLQRQNQNYQAGNYISGVSVGSSDRVKIRDPKTGRVGTVPSNQADAARQQGYEVVQ